MKLIEKILLAQDFGKSSENVVSTAIEFAKIFHSEVIPVHVLPNDLMNEKVKILVKEAAMKKLVETADLIKSEGVKAGEPILAFGSPHDAIVSAANEINANLILTGSGETQKGDKFLLGTSTKGIIQKSEKPVFVVKEDVALNVQHILCPVDFSKNSKRALKNAITMSHRFKAELTVLSVCELPSLSWFSSEHDWGEENDKRYEEHKKLFDEFLKDFNFSGLTWAKETSKGNPATEILNAITGKIVDLLIMGTSGKSGLNRLVMGSVAEKVVREVPCSFLMIKSEDIISLPLETEISDIDKHYNLAMQLMEDGFFEESIKQFKLCQSINIMNVPSYYGIAKVYEKLNEPEKAEKYRNLGREVLDQIWNSKIEEDVRRFRNH
jgi:nucleotide-binding universal stress UspA family protein